MHKVDLSKYNNNWYQPGNSIKRLLWYFVNVLFFINPLFPFSFFKIWLLKLFGAKVGNGVVIKPGVNIKYPWFLSIGEYTWIGENVWIDNLAQVSIGSHCCVSQGALLLTGNHNYKKETFDLITQPIKLEQGSWVGAKAVVTPGAILKSHAILTVNSVGIGELQENTIYQGNPAVELRKRQFK